MARHCLPDANEPQVFTAAGTVNIDRKLTTNVAKCGGSGYTARDDLQVEECFVYMEVVGVWPVCRRRLPGPPSDTGHTTDDAAEAIPLQMCHLLFHNFETFTFLANVNEYFNKGRVIKTSIEILCIN